MIYVDSNGADASNCGTQIVQCKTIQAGVDKAVAGDTVVVAAGTYNESVNIKKGITVKGAGAATTTIDGAGLTLPNGLVNITQPGGNVTFTGFTVENQSAPGGDNLDSYAVTINDSNADDTVTVSNNTFPAVSPARPDENPYGVDSANTAARQVITGNDFSGLWRGILLEGTVGPVDVSSNDFHDLISVPTDTGSESTYPPKGIFFLADTNAAATDQNVTNNTFENYGGIGVSYRAGYDLGGCAGDTVCKGSITGTATGNTFDLDATPSSNITTANQQGAAFNLQALYEGGEVNLTAGGNTGTVASPSQPFIEVPSDGTTAITPGSTPNKIVPNPAPKVAVTTPSTLVAGGDAKDGSVSVTNAGTPLSNVRYDVKITGTSGIKASQLKLQYDSDPSASVLYKNVTLTGTASSGSSITGYIDASAGSTLATSADAVVTGLRLSVTDASAPEDTLKTTVQLDQVSSVSGNPVINTLVTSAAASTVVTAPPAAAVDTVTPTLDTPLAQPDRVQVVTIAVTDVNGDAPATGTNVDVLVSGASVANGTVQTNSGGTARFLFRVQHAGDFTVKAVAGGKSGSVTGTTPLRNVTTTLKVSTPSKGVITAVASTSPVRPGVKMAFVIDQGSKRIGIVTAITDSGGVARQNLTGLRSGTVYAITARIYGDADSDSVNSARILIRVK